mgnify:CR=1 FL=1
MTHIIALVLVAFPLILLLYSYAGYPAILWIASRWRAEARPEVEPTEWPSVTIIVPCYNEEQSIGRTIEALLALDYPRERLHLLVISDALDDSVSPVVGDEFWAEWVDDFG